MHRNFKFIALTLLSILHVSCTETEVTGSNGSSDNSSNAINTLSFSCGSKSCLRGPGATLEADQIDFDDPIDISNAGLFVYFLINGASSGYSLSDISNIGFETANGYLSLFNAEINTVNSLLSESDIGSCEQIDVGAADISSNDYVIQFSESGLAIPSVFDRSEGTSFEKSVDITKDGSNYMRVDLLCDETGVLETTAVRVNVQEGNSTRELLAYYQSSSSDSEVQADFFLTSSDLNLVARFETNDGDDFSFTGIFTPLTSPLLTNQGPIAVAITGESSENISRMGINADGNESVVLTNTDVATAWTETCFDLDDSSISGLCQFAISNEITSSIIAGDGSWTIDNTANTDLSNL